MLAGDERALEEFSDRYIPSLYRFARRRLDGDRELTSEIVQTTVCKVIAKLDSFRGEAALTTWLCACCRNEIAAHYRRKGRPIREVELPSEEPASDASLNPVLLNSPEVELLRKERVELVHDALDSLPPHYGQALEWKYLDRLPVKEIARRLKLRPKAAESLLTRARSSFREVYGRLTADLEISADEIGTANRRMAREP
jgi:RNA polymerase sigma-70 factor (ECF subfamily)